MFLLPSLLVDPNPRTPYIGCNATQGNPIIYVNWILLLFYDAGAIVIYHTTYASFAEILCISDVPVDGHPSVESL